MVYLQAGPNWRLSLGDLQMKTKAVKNDKGQGLFAEFVAVKTVKKTTNNMSSHIKLI